MKNPSIKKLLMLTAFFVSLFTFHIYSQDSTVTSFTKVTNIDSAGVFYIVQGSADRKVEWDQMVDAVEDSMGKTNIAYKNKANTFSSAQTFSSGVTFGSTSTFTGNPTVNGRPTFNKGADFSAGTYGTVRFYDTLIVRPTGGVFVIEGGAKMLVYGDIQFISGTFLLLNSAASTQTFKNLTYTGSDGASYVTYDYGSTAGQRDTISTYRYLLANYFKKSGSNTLSGSNTFSGKVTYTKPQVFTPTAPTMPSGSGMYDVLNASKIIVMDCSDGANTTITDFDNGTNGQEIIVQNSPASTFNLIIDDGSEIQLVGGADRTLNPGDSIHLFYSSSNDIWYEIGDVN